MTSDAGTGIGYTYLRIRGSDQSRINVTINGRQYRMACEDGQEGHLTMLAKDLDGLWPECKEDLTREMAMGFDAVATGRPG